MDSFLFALNAVLPIILTVFVGYFIKRIGIVDSSLSKPLNKIVFRVLLPALLFINIYKMEGFSGFSGGFIIYAAVATVLLFIIAIPLSRIITDEKPKRGALIQGVFRSNYALLGIPLTELLFGTAGLAEATILSAVSVPLFNVLAVITLSIFGDGQNKVKVKKVLIDIIKNPLIVGVALGLVSLGIRALFVEIDVSFRLSKIEPIYTVIEYLSRCATPIALISLGIQFEFSAIKELRREIIFGVVSKVVAVPIVGLGVALLLFDFTSANYAALFALFATPVAVSTVPMAHEMGADARLAGQLVIWGTAISAITIFLFAFALRAMGVF
jgi:predicted permease